MLKSLSTDLRKRKLINSDFPTSNLATTLVFGGDENGPYKFVANTSLWAKFVPNNTNSTLFVSVTAGTDDGILEDDLNLQSINFYEENDLLNPIASEDSNVFIYNNYWGIYMGSLVFNENSTYFIEIKNPTSGNLNIRVGYD